MWGSGRALAKAVIYHGGVSLSIYFLSEEKLEREFWPRCPEGTRCCWRELHTSQKLLYKTFLSKHGACSLVFISLPALR